MNVCRLAAVAAMGVALSGCATIIEGTTQSVSVNTTPEEGAQCTLTNSQGTWYATSPGSTSVHKTKTELDVTCMKPGFQPGHVVAMSHFGATTAANVIAGGVIGVGVDAASGANYHYDSPIVVALGPPAGAQSSPGTPAQPAPPAANSPSK
jgi:ABC-type Fe3+-hydroxamate transport system substrate-binding protein